MGFQARNRDFTFTYVFLVIQDILTVKIERTIYVNEEKAVSEIQILINKTFLLFSHHELLMSFISYYLTPLNFIK